MRVPDMVLKSVGFVGEVVDEESGEGDLHATGFILSIPTQEPNRKLHVFVTAKHAVEALKDREVYFLTNRKGGGAIRIRDHAGCMWVHQTDKTCDCVVMPFNVAPEMDYNSIAFDSLVTPETMQSYNIGIGDEVFFPGLFTYAPGDKENMPIVRHGNLAMLPKEQIQIESGFADVYLIEARSIGGLSGSPVFVRPTKIVTMGDGKQCAVLADPDTFFCLGLICGHWDIREGELNKAFAALDRRNGVNLGIGIVVPAYKIREIIENTPDLVKLRQGALVNDSLCSTTNRGS
jgi:hypothetical protein